MVIDSLIKHIEEWAPPGVAWDRDNTGLLAGSRKDEIKNVFICLELNGQALKEAVRKNCNFIFTHHPFIFNPLKNLDFDKNPKALIIKKLIEKNISLYSAHTNLDYTKEGVSFALADKLKLTGVEFLKPLNQNQFKLVVFVPGNNIDKVSEAVYNSGGGRIGEYKNCSFRSKGEGTFFGSEKTNPAAGRKNNYETVDEIRIEFIVDSWNINKTVDAMIKAHPYEEPAFDIYPLKNENRNYGEGVTGFLKTKMPEKEFIRFVCKSLGAEGLRHTELRGKTISKVALCGGAGSDLLNTAVSSGADAFITADIKYHTFLEAGGKILLIDAGHYETEIHSLSVVKKKIEKFFSSEKEKIKVNLFSGSTNNIKFYKQKEY